MRRPHPRERGFTLLSVMLALVLVLTVLMTTLRESNEALTGAAFHRDRELTSAAVDVAVARAVDVLSKVDGTMLQYMGSVGDPAAPFDIFDNAAAENFPGVIDLLDPDTVNPWEPVSIDPSGAYISYPPRQLGTPFEMRNQLAVRVGAVRGQRVRPPPGEDVRVSGGSIVHVQVRVRANRPGTSTLEQRYEVGVRVPEPGSYP